MSKQLEKALFMVTSCILQVLYSQYKKQPLCYQRIKLAENHGHRSFVLFKYYITANTIDLSKCHIFLLLMLKPSFDVCYCQRLETVMSAFNIQYRDLWYPKYLQVRYIYNLKKTKDAGYWIIVLSRKKKRYAVFSLVVYVSCFVPTFMGIFLQSITRSNFLFE